MIPSGNLLVNAAIKRTYSARVLGQFVVRSGDASAAATSLID
jgi:hypothetical protein